ncbi:hypothetical protein CFC21_045933 [Triticum aestivum]|uniref:NAC transcription factor n=2 Tax=Triticum aestivum TaxID=4565 RepID=A0A9R1JZ71_WHEAT|nr:NAC domain-containing protein 2 [Triticum aestivum]ADG85701.1 NAC transcription factor [Triticum aestivum]KAF7034985.1 hypothetical protein CFC21_045933 [Triticum aestivum]
MTIELQTRPSLPAPAGTPPRAGTGLPPGFRFYPTDEELIVHYLRRRAAAAPCPAAVIAEVDIYKLDPWELPSRAVFEGDNDEWYFFSPRDRKYPNGVRPNRAAGSGYWKATGTDKPITAGGVPGGEVVGVKKALVFYQGRPPKGLKTNWIMHEYRLADAHAAAAAHTYRPPTRFKASSSMRLDDWVLCRIYKKPNPQQLSPFYEPSPSPSSMDASLGLGHHHHHHQYQQQQHHQQQEDTSSSSRMLPRNPSVSDYLVDYSAVSELFDSMPPPPQPETTGSSAGQFFLGTTAGAGDGEASTARKRQATADSNNDGEMSSLHASKRWLGSDGSMTMMNGGFSIFGPDQPSQQDRI